MMDKNEKRAYDIFYHWKNLTTLKNGYKENDPEFESTYSPYLINKFASLINALLPLVADIERYGDIPKETHFRFYDSILPKRYIKLDFLKKTKTEDNKEDSEYVQRYFEFGKRDLELAMKLMSKDDIDKIKRKYGGT